MIYTHFIGRIGQDCKTIIGEHGNFISLDLAVDNYTKGEKSTTWVRVRSKRPNHLKLGQYLTKGKLILVEGTLNEPTIWTDKDGNNHVQLAISADNINFVNFGKKKEEQNNGDNNSVTVENKDNTKDNTMPFNPPTDTGDDLPF